jgi:DNA-binding response OmpR family regulator
MKPVPEPRAESPEPKAELKVLLIDDTPEIAELLTFALRDRGFEVVAEGYSALINERIIEHRADAVVLDCSAYDMSESLFDTIRDHPPHANLPIVIISDTPEEADASLRERDAQHVLLVPKPFTGSQVARALGELLPAAG